MKQKLIDLIPYGLILLVGLYLSQLFTGLVLALSKYKLEFGDHIQETLQKLAIHPVHYYQLYISQRNPLLIISSIAVVIYVLYFAFKKNTKNNEWNTSKTDTHGSATWGNAKDLMKDYFSITPKNLADNFNKEIDQDILKALQKRENEKEENQ